MRRLILALLLTLTLTLPFLATPAEVKVQAAVVRPGLALTTLVSDGREVLAVTSAERFELLLDEGGIVAWYDLRRDPGRANNLVLAGQTLVAHQSRDGKPLRAPWSIQLDTPVVARVAWNGPGFSYSYTIWAAGQVSITTSGATAPMSLARRPEATTGAALQSTGATAATLFLDAWTGEDRPASATTLAATAQAGGAQITVPAEAALRAPQLTVTGWPGPAHSLRKGAALLIEGQDYLAHWDAATGTLYAQVLAGLPAGGTAAERTFTFLPQNTAGLSLGISGRTLSDDGMLQIDGNMPDNNGDLSFYDLFFIPYIQSSPTVTLTGVFQGDGAGVEFVLNGVSKKVFGAASSTLTATFTLPRFGEYAADGYVIDQAGTRLSGTPDDRIAPLGYGRIMISIGDSITAGARGDGVDPGTANFPVTSYLRSPTNSQDKRNIFQFDNRNIYRVNNQDQRASFKRGYQVDLNNYLTACGEAPVFILNSGYGGLRLSYSRTLYTSPPNNSALSKLPAYLDQIDKLGARYLMVQLGTNDAFDARGRTNFRDDLRRLVSVLRGNTTGMNLWLARIPYSLFPTVTDPEDNADRQKRVVDYNREILTTARLFHSPDRPVRAGPDFHTYFFNNQNMLDDGTHPTQAGYNVMAQLWAGQSVGDMSPTAFLPCETFFAEGNAPPPPVTLTPRVYLPGLNRSSS